MVGWEGVKHQAKRGYAVFIVRGSPQIVVMILPHLTLLLGSRQQMEPRYLINILQNMDRKLDCLVLWSNMADVHQVKTRKMVTMREYIYLFCPDLLLFFWNSFTISWSSLVIAWESISTALFICKNDILQFRDDVSCHIYGVRNVMTEVFLINELFWMRCYWERVAGSI